MTLSRKFAFVVLAEWNLDKLDEKWGPKYPLVIRSWRRNWDRLTAYFKYTPAIRKIIYTTNIVEGYHRQIRKVSNNRSVFPNDKALMKLMYLATIGAQKKWTMPKRDWAETIGQPAIHFEGRLVLDLN